MSSVFCGVKMKYLVSMRINVIGTSGSGKSTLARKIAQKLNLRYVEMDKVFWRENWTHLNDDDFFESLRKELAGEDWVLDGNYTRTIPVKWVQPMIVIWIDLPFWQTFYQAITRALNRAYTKVELWEGTGNRESFRQSFFSKDSVVLWTLQTFFKNRIKCRNYFTDSKYEHIEFFRVGSHHEADLLINDLMTRKDKSS